MASNDPLVSFDNSQGPRPLLRTAEIAAGGIGFVAAHRVAMRSFPNLPTKAYNFFSALEERSPARILRTFGLSELYSSYLPQSVEIGRSDLFMGTQLTPMGEHLKRMLGTNYDLNQISDAHPMKFLRAGDGSAF